MNLRIAILVTATTVLLACAGTVDHLRENPRVRISTTLGDMVVELYPDLAPVTCPNFLRYVDEGRYLGASFYRTVTMQNQPENDVKIEVIQGGLGWDDSDLRLPAIGHETTSITGLFHKDGTISMARLEPGSADSEFFICVGDQPELDFGGTRNPDGQGFAAFGSVISGHEVIRLIHRSDEVEQMIDPVVPIIAVGRER